MVDAADLWTQVTAGRWKRRGRPPRPGRPIRFRDRDQVREVRWSHAGQSWIGEHLGQGRLGLVTGRACSGGCGDIQAVALAGSYFLVLLQGVLDRLA
jgi:hypothetical protein